MNISFSFKKVEGESHIAHTWHVEVVSAHCQTGTGLLSNVRTKVVFPYMKYKQLRRYIEQDSLRTFT